MGNDSEGKKDTGAAGKSTMLSGTELGTTAGVAVLFLLLRLLAVSDWKWETAAAVVDSLNFDDVPAIVFGTLFAEPWVSGVLLGLLLPLIVLDVLWQATHSFRRVFHIRTLLLLAAILAASYAWVKSFSAWMLLAVLVGFVVVVILARLLWRHGESPGKRFASKLLKNIGRILVVAFLVVAAFVTIPWMVHEKIETRSTVIHGWVLEAQPGFLKVLTDEREVVIVDTSNVVSRHLDE